MGDPGRQRAGRLRHAHLSRGGPAHARPRAPGSALDAGGARGSRGGLLGAATVALWFLVYDTAAGTPLRTPALLGAALFHGLRDPSALAISTPLVVEYTLVHAAGFIAFGLATAGLLALADHEPQLLFVFFMLFCCFEGFFGALVAVRAGWLLEGVPWWTILGGNLLAAVVMLTFFFREHRMAWREFRHARR